MFFSSRPKTRYSVVHDGECDEETKVGTQDRPYVIHTKSSFSLSWVIGLVVLSCLSTISVFAFFRHGFPLHEATSVNAPALLACTQPTIRHEWRTLSTPDKDAYIKAVQCLATQPSKLLENGTMYDDFPWVHKVTAPSAHASAPFLPWHRYYIHAYEKALRDTCAYTGDLPYWDWSQDWSDFAAAPIWSSESGFGGNGDSNGPLTVGEGRCVINGPFAGLEAAFYDDQYQPHCLSRGFSTGEELSDLAELIKPDAIAEVMREPKFEDFASKLETRAHTFISRSIKGDFSKYTGPYDPVFFLHHTNLDRLWSEWQNKDPQNVNAYGGKASSLMAAGASLKNKLDVGGLLESVPVSEVMETTSGPFCYRY